MALKFVHDVDNCGFDDEISSTKNVKKIETTKNNNSKKSKDKVVQSYNNSLGQQCFGCQGYDHLRSECPTYLRS